MALTDSLPTQDSGGLTIVDERLILAGDIVSTTGGAPRTGVLPSHTNALVTGLASMAVSVASFNGVFSRTGAGVEKAANNGATTVTIDTAPGSNSRLDVVWARAQFAASGDANSLVVFGKTTGTAAASPAKPAIPAGAMELATVLVPSTATTMQSSGVVITQTHQYTAMEGGTVLLRNQVEADAWTPHDGSKAYRLDLSAEFTRVGGQWIPTNKMGVVTDGYVWAGTWDDKKPLRRIFLGGSPQVDASSVTTLTFPGGGFTGFVLHPRITLMSAGSPAKQYVVSAMSLTQMSIQLLTGTGTGLTAGTAVPIAVEVVGG